MAGDDGSSGPSEGGSRHGEADNSGADHDDSDDEPLSEDVVERAERLTRQAREAVDEAEVDAYRADRESILAAHGYTARVREEDDRAVLVLHPSEWVDDGTVQPDRVEDVDRAVEVPLSGAGDPDDWDAVEAHNRAIAETVAAGHGEPHGATAHALANFAGNHYAKRLDDLSAGELEAFREDYLPRNAWPTDEQRDALVESIRLTYVAADAPVPGSRDE